MSAGDKKKSRLQSWYLIWHLNTSMRNLGLSGMSSLNIRADVRLGTEQRTTNSLQLWKSRNPREKWAQVLGITNQARPAGTRWGTIEHTGLHLFRYCRPKENKSLPFWSRYIKCVICLALSFLITPALVAMSLDIVLFMSFPTCSQDVSCHPKGGQSADHRTSPPSGHELREVGEDDRDGPADTAEGKENRIHFSDCLFMLHWQNEGTNYDPGGCSMFSLSTETYFIACVTVSYITPGDTIQNICKSCAHPMPLMNRSSRKSQNQGATLARPPNTPFTVRDTTRTRRRPLWSARYPHM